VAVLGIAVIVVLAGFLFAVRNFGRAILGKLPPPGAALEFLTGSRACSRSTGGRSGCW
jgi:hypothetical protein